MNTYSLRQNANVCALKDTSYLQVNTSGFSINKQQKYKLLCSRALLRKALEQNFTS